MTFINWNEVIELIKSGWIISAIWLLSRIWISYKDTNVLWIDNAGVYVGVLSVLFLILYIIIWFKNSLDEWTNKKYSDMYKQTIKDKDQIISDYKEEVILLRWNFTNIVTQTSRTYWHKEQQYIDPESWWSTYT